MRLKLQTHLLMIEESVSTEKNKTSTSIRSTPHLENSTGSTQFLVLMGFYSCTLAEILLSEQKAEV